MTNESAFDLLHDIVGNGHRANRHARMNPPGRDAKYTTVHHALTDDQLAAHLAGAATYAAIIIGQDGLVSGSCIELDRDALVGAGRVLEAASKRQVVACSIAVKGAGEHDGSHTWILFAGRVDPAAARSQAQRIAADAGYPDAEIWPKGNAIRLPFGVHTHTQTRGRLLLQSGEVYDLDDADQFSLGAAAVALLPRNDTPPAPPKVEPTNPYIVRVKGSNTTITGESPIARFNADHKAADLIEHYGGKRTRDGWTCNCGETHSHGTQLQVTSQGKIVSYSDHCRWAPHYLSGQCTDAFGLYAIVEHGGDTKRAVKALLPEPIKKRSSAVSDKEPEPHYTDEQRAAWKASKNAANAAAASELHARIAAQIEPGADDRLRESERAIVGIQLDWMIAHHAVSCLQGRATIARLSGYSLGAVKHAMARLEEFGYFESSGKGGRPIDTARRNFSRGSLFDTQTILLPNDDPRIEYKLDRIPDPVLACERAPAPAPERACEPDDLDGWAWCEDTHGGEELSALEQPTVVGGIVEPGAGDGVEQEIARWRASPRGKAWLEWVAQHPDPEGAGVAPERTIDLGAWHAIEQREARNARFLDDVALDRTVEQLELAAAVARRASAHRQADYWYAVCRIYRAEIDRREQADAEQQAKVNRILKMTDAELAAHIAGHAPAPPIVVSDHDSLDQADEPDASHLLATLFRRIGNADKAAEWETPEPDAYTPQVEPDEDDAGGASYDPGADWTVKRGRKPPKEADAARKARRQARLRAMDAPELTREYWVLTNKAKKCDGRQRDMLLDLAKEVQHYRDLAYARRDEAVEDAPRSQAKPTVGPPPMLALFAGGGP